MKNTPRKESDQTINSTLIDIYIELSSARMPAEVVASVSRVSGSSRRASHSDTTTRKALAPAPKLQSYDLVL